MPITITSINDRILPRSGYVLLSAGPDQGYFVSIYTNAGHLLKVYYNNDGKEVFAVTLDIPRPWYSRLWAWITKL